MLSIIVAVDEKYGIGAKGTLPWPKLPSDMKHFKELTMGKEDKPNSVIMGRKTFESIPKKFRPLTGRVNIVLSKSGEIEDNFYTASSLQEAIQMAKINYCAEVWVIGGESVYKEALQMKEFNHVWITRIRKIFPECDAFFPQKEFESEFEQHANWPEITENGITYQFEMYKRKT